MKGSPHCHSSLIPSSQWGQQHPKSTQKCAQRELLSLEAQGAYGARSGAGLGWAPSGSWTRPNSSAADKQPLPWNANVKLCRWLPLLKWERGWEGPSLAWGCQSFPVVNGKKEASLEGEGELKPQLECPGGTAVSPLTTQGSWEAGLRVIKLVFVSASFPNCH